MFDYYLKFETKAKADKWISQNQDPMNIAIDVVGIINDQVDTGEVGEDGLPIYSYVPKEGYHVNVRSRTEMDIKEAIEVNNPIRVFA